MSGENRVVVDEARLLREAGHEVNLVEFEPGRESPVQLALRSTWSLQATRQIADIARSCCPDIWHFHNLFPMISPHSLRMAHRYAPVVMTLHNFRLACLPATFLRDGKICEACRERIPWRGVVHRCYRGSAAGSLALATSLAVHKSIKTFLSVDCFVALSSFQLARLAPHHVDAEKTVVRPNFAWPSRRREGAGDYFLSLGRLSPEKGLDDLVATWPGPLPLLVAGDGPERERLRAMARSGVRFLGAVEPAEASKLLANSRALLMPTRCFEGSPRVIP
jgi:glycosyltransferase involved in cell wall biosynthesis